MTDFKDFRERVRRRIAAAAAEPVWTPAETEQYMADLGPRRDAFEETAHRLVSTVIRPRMAIVAEPFANAAADRNAHLDRCVWWFGYCERFPATTRLEIVVEHDATIEHLLVRYGLDVMPVFFKYEAHDKLATPLAEVDDGAVADWVEQKLLAFLDTYLALDRGPDDSGDEAVTDPVCGMRIGRSSAGATTQYRGHPYYFCSDDCRRQFAEQPLRYVRVETD